jgi:demethylmenaquinone methyltransferase / 2-methoxy-6-polyprenyl-1,4-benzoquinol methylase
MKKKDTPEMFNQIADDYDRLNHLLSFGLDRKWRRKFVKNLSHSVKGLQVQDIIKEESLLTIIDIACGTGDLSNELLQIKGKKHYALDPSEKMLSIAKSKLKQHEFILATAEAIPLPDKSVDIITVAFGIRNFENLSIAFSEFYRILKPNGVVSIMEFSVPRNLFIKFGFLLYLRTIIPVIGKIFAKNRQAYQYLSRSIVDFAKNTEVFKNLESNGFKKLNQRSLVLGGVRIYTVVKL